MKIFQLIAAVNHYESDLKSKSFFISCVNRAINPEASQVTAIRAFVKANQHRPDYTLSDEELLNLTEQLLDLIMNADITYALQGMYRDFPAKELLIAEFGALKAEALIEANASYSILKDQTFLKNFKKMSEIETRPWLANLAQHDYPKNPVLINPELKDDTSPAFRN